MHRRARSASGPHRLALPCALALLLAALPAPAQRPPAAARALPVAPPSIPVRPMPAEAGRALPAAVERRLASLPVLPGPALSHLQLQQSRELVRRHPALLDLDPAGAVVVRSEVVAIDPTPGSLARARAAGFEIGEERVLDALGLRIVVLRARPELGTRAALRRLRRADPDGEYDFNHLYRGSAAAGAGIATARGGGVDGGRQARIGLVDSGVSAAHPALRSAALHTWGCDGADVPDAHGTAVASLLVAGAGAGTALYAADIYCGRPTGGAATGFAEAMAWLARERVGVINLSLVGPHNALLQRAVRALAARGHVLVAAVGNDGPAAAPLFPAAYPEVIAVTAVDDRGRALPEAGRGAHVDFAAPGHDLRAARPREDWTRVRGTSFAAPLVARLAAQHAPEPAPGNGERVRALLAAQARDLGRKGRDEVYGLGLLAGDASPAVAGAR
jgi:subtilisin family serine protease